MYSYVMILLVFVLSEVLLQRGQKCRKHPLLYIPHTLRNEGHLVTSVQI